MKITVKGYLHDVMIKKNSKEQLVTDAFLIQEDKVIRCRWRGDQSDKIHIGVNAEITGNLVNWSNDKGNIFNMVLVNE